MDSKQFLKFIEDKVGITLQESDLERDISTLEGWDSLAFVYVVIGLEKERNTRLNIEKLLECRNMREIMEMMNHEVNENK